MSSPKDDPALLEFVSAGAAMRAVQSARAARMLAHFDALDRLLVAKGFPPSSRWWRETLQRFYEGGRRQCVLRVGRRGGKSSTLCRIAVLEALYGEHVIPPGDVGIVGIVSVSRDEAASRLRTIKAILDALRVRYRERDQTIELQDRPIVFRVFTASVAGVVGGTWICAICDEVSRWRDAESGANPATQVLASLRPTLATMPFARIFLSSSPLANLDAHATAFDAGETDFQIVAHAPTWVANPSITEAETHALEPDEKVWSREFAAIPSAAVSGAFAAEDIEAAFRPHPKGRYYRPIIVTDVSSGRGDSFTWCPQWWCRASLNTDDILREVGPGGGIVAVLGDDGRPLIREDAAPKYRPQLVIGNIESIDGKFYGAIDLETIVRRFIGDARRCRAKRIIGDQRESLAMFSACGRHGYRFDSIPWTEPRKVNAVARIRRMLAERSIVLPLGDQALRDELVQFEEKILPSGAISFSAPRNRHDDRVALLITAAMADADAQEARAGRTMPGSPGAPQPGARIDVPWLPRVG